MTQIVPSLLVATVVLVGAAVADTSESERAIVVMGDSIAAGYGVDPAQAFPAVLQSLADEAGYEVKVVNAGVSGDTTAGGARRITWLLKRPVDVLIIELGGNDALRGIPTETSKKNLESIIIKTRERYPQAKILLTGMQIHENMGKEYTAQFKAVFEKVAKEQGVAFVPFLLDGVGGVETYNQADEIHPNPAGHKIVAANVWKALEPLLKTTPPTDQ